MPAVRTPTANSAARSGGDWITKVSTPEICGPTTPTVATTSVTVATMAMAPHRRTISSIRGNAMYSWASTAIDQNDALGLGARTTF